IAMDTTPHGQLPPDLASAQRRFEAWRERRETGGPGPPPPLGGALPPPQAHGGRRPAPPLRLPFYPLEESAVAPTRRAPERSRHAFVELTPPAIVARQCQFEFDNGSGATMRVQLVGYDAADVEALSRSFWDAR